MANFRRSPTINNLCPCHINLILRLHAMANDNRLMNSTRWHRPTHCIRLRARVCVRCLALVHISTLRPVTCNAIYVISAVNISMINCVQSITIAKDLFVIFLYFLLLSDTSSMLKWTLCIGPGEKKYWKIQKWSTTSTATRVTLFAHNTHILTPHGHWVCMCSKRNVPENGKE